MALQSLDIVRRSATTTSSPSVRQAQTGTVAKLIDTTKCIGCKACQVACMEWNDLRDEIGTNIGGYQNPHDLTDQSWTLMRFAEYENPARRDLPLLPGRLRTENQPHRESRPRHLPRRRVRRSSGSIPFPQPCRG